MLRRSDDSIFRVLDENRRRGWLTRDARKANNPRDIVLFDDRYAGDLLDTERRQAFSLIKGLISVDAQASGSTITGATKHFVNQVFAGEAPLFTQRPYLCLAIYKFGPVPAIVFRESQGWRFAIYPRLTSEVDGKKETPYPSDLYNKVLSYKHVGIDRLLLHYLEHVTGRLHDIASFRSFSDALNNLDQVSKEVQESLFGKLTDIGRLADSSDRTERRFAEDILQTHRQALEFVRFAAYMSLCLVEEFRRVYGVANSTANYDQRLASLASTINIDPEDHYDREFTSIVNLWRAFKVSDLDELIRVHQSEQEEWIKHLSEFALFVTNLGATRKDCTNSQWWIPRVFVSCKFGSESSAGAEGQVNALLQASTNSQLPMVITVAKGIPSQELKPLVHQRIYENDWTLAVIPSRRSASTSQDRHEWLTLEIEHSLLLQRRPVQLAVEQDGENELAFFKNQLSKRNPTWLYEDIRLQNEPRTKRVQETLDQTFISFSHKQPGQIDQNLLSAMQNIAKSIMVQKMKRLIDFWLFSIKLPARRAAIAMAFLTWRHPMPSIELANKTLELAGGGRDKDFWRYRRHITTVSLNLDGSTLQPIVYKKGMKKFKGEWESILSRFGYGSLSFEQRDAIFKYMETYVQGLLSDPRFTKSPRPESNGKFQGGEDRIQRKSALRGMN